MKIASIIIGVVLAVILMVGGVYLFQNVFSRAADYTPIDVVVADITQNSARLSWATGIESQSVVEYGTTPTALNFFAPEAQKARNHIVDLTLLSPQTTYYFQIKVGDKKYDNGGVPWTFTTKGRDGSGGTSTGLSPTPVQRLEIPDAPSGSVKVANCPETDCREICLKLQKGCSTQDLVKNKCVGKVNLSTCAVE